MTRVTNVLRSVERMAPGAIALFAILVCAQAQSEESLGQDWVAVAAERLDGLRGGVETSKGLHVAFGIQRAIYANGRLIARTGIHIADIRKMTTKQAAALDRAANSGLLVQKGPNNQFDISGLSPGSTVIQNTLNNQKIATLTTITTKVDSLPSYQGLNMQESLQRALNQVAGVR